MSTKLLSKYWEKITLLNLDETDIYDRFDGSEGQDRKNYSDTQDRESYVPDPGWFKPFPDEIEEAEWDAFEV